MATLSIDINCDLGEGFQNDASLMRYISSANIACGGHAGDEGTMAATAELALKNGVAIGAHPGYEDLDNFGRRRVDLAPDRIRTLILNQIERLHKAIAPLGAAIRHVKPHGALYNDAARDASIAHAIAAAVREYSPHLLLFGLSGSHSISEAGRLGVVAVNEAFADRNYEDDLTLTPRTEADALLDEPAVAAERILDILKYGMVRTRNGLMMPIEADTVCIHGDGADRVAFARELRSALDASHIVIAAPTRESQ